MSEENVEIVRAAIEAWNTKDMERLRELYDPDATATPPPGWPEPGPFVGRDAILREFDHIREAFGAADALVARGDFLAVKDAVVVRMAWVGAGQGPAMDMEVTVTWTMRGERICGLEYFWNHEEALKAAGLSE